MSKKSKENLKIYSKGHKYYKSSDCPVCPICEEERKPEKGFLSQISAPARRALESEGITTFSTLSEFSKKEILALHGIGPSTIPKLEHALEEEDMAF